MFSMLFEIDFESVPINSQMKFIELQNDVDLKENFPLKTLLEFYKRVSPKNKISKRAQKLICFLQMLIFAKHSFLR